MMPAATAAGWPQGLECAMLQSMLASILRNTELSQMADLVSPALWRVVPLRRLWGVTRQLVRNYRDRETFEQAALALEGWLEARGVARGDLEQLALPLSSLQDGVPAEGVLADARLRAWIGQRVLELYFTQLMQGRLTLLDLRPERLGLGVHQPGESSLVDSATPKLLWSPKRYYLRLSDEFSRAVQGLYLGFYRDDRARFAAALEALDLVAAESIFRRHFGDGKAPQRFALSQLLETLHDVFVCCDRAKARLSGEFVALGFYLTSLYQTLELLDVALDVRGAFDVALGE
jgi:hypothetical protein